MSRRSLVVIAVITVVVVTLVAAGALVLLSSRSAPSAPPTAGAASSSQAVPPSSPLAAPSPPTGGGGNAERAERDQPGAQKASEPSAADERKRPAPPLRKKSGVTRVGCDWACEREAECNLRDAEACASSSCEPDRDVRIPTTMDYCFVDADACIDVVACSCAESCWKRGECARDHGGDDDCARSCRVLAGQEPARLYRDNRCVLEHRCGDIAVCGG